jgi:hypothetical protein
MEINYKIKIVKMFLCHFVHKVWRFRLNSDLPEYPKEEILRRFKAMTFSCIYCDADKPISFSTMDYQPKGSGPHVTGFFICPNCKNKYMVKIEDLGKVGHV